MSTKIYDGLRIPRALDLLEVARLRNELAQRCNNDAEHRLVVSIVRTAIGRIDDVALGLVEAPSSPDALAMSYDVHAAWRENKQRTNPRTNFSFEAVLLPTPDGHATLAVCFGGPVDVETNGEGLRPWRSWFMKQWGAEEYGWGDQSEGPEDMDPQDWEQRGKDWNAVLPHDVASFADQGTVVTLCHERYHTWWWPDQDRLAADWALPDVQTVLNRHHRARCCVVQHADTWWEKENHDESPQTTEEAVKRRHAFREFYCSDEGRAWVVAQTEKVASLLPEVPSSGHEGLVWLRQPWNDPSLPTASRAHSHRSHRTNRS